jgi:PAS domain-containing protein
MLVGYIAAEFTYQRFFEELDQRLQLSLHHRCAVYLGDDRLYASSKLGAPSPDGPLALESVFSVQNRRLRIAMEPSEESVRKNRRFLPELSLFAGMGITLLLGLSIHLARTARASLVAAETSNQLLRSENDERRRVEAKLKVSDERLRLTLDATVVGIFEWDCRLNTIHFSRSVWAMLGQLTGNEYTTPAAWKALIHAEDLAVYEAALQTQITGLNAFIDPVYRVRTDTGVWRWLYMRSKIVA